jgi:hypothetical protein
VAAGQGKEGAGLGVRGEWGLQAWQGAGVYLALDIDVDPFLHEALDQSRVDAQAVVVR